MTRGRSLKKSESRPPSRVLPNVLQANRDSNHSDKDDAIKVHELSNLESLLIDDPVQPQSDTSPDNPNPETAALHDELNSFRQKWKYELDTKVSESTSTDVATTNVASNESKENYLKARILSGKELHAVVTNNHKNPRDVYAAAKKLFLKGVELEQDESHHESIRYYKQAMQLCPDIESLIFKEQCEASLRSGGQNPQDAENLSGVDGVTAEDNIAPLCDRVLSALHENLGTNLFRYCRPTLKHKANVTHISELPREILILICRYVIGQELDLTSLESLGMVSRGFFILSRDPSLWRSVCHRTWGNAILCIKNKKENLIPPDWRKLYLEKPRVNCDGVYFSRTRYFRQGDISFPEMTYRPLHSVRYYRYLRFFPDKRVLILTTNDEPERIVPIFRHALHAKQISELSILEGSYEFTDTNQIVVEAEKDFATERNAPQQQQHHHLTHRQRRQAMFHWSRQTPVSQKSNMRFELKTLESRPWRNNVLKWLEYSITTTLETGQEVTTFDLNQDNFPSLAFSRVKRFNLKLTEPLSSH